MIHLNRNSHYEDKHEVIIFYNSECKEQPINDSNNDYNCFERSNARAHSKHSSVWKNIRDFRDPIDISNMFYTEVFEAYTCIANEFHCWLTWDSPILKNISTVTNGNGLILKSSLLSDCHRCYFRLLEERKDPQQCFKCINRGYYHW